MAVFLVNTCKFNSCGQTFATLTELIRHIEDTHLDFDPRSIEQHELQQQSCLPISYILRVFTDNYRKEQNSLSGTHPPRKLMRSHSPVSSLCSTTPTGSEMEEEDNESDTGESSIDSWPNITADDTANAILKVMSSTPNSSNNSNSDDKDRPYVCMINGCKKRYRNANGLKYHTKSAHNTSNTSTTAQKKELIGPAKVYKCHCGKIYKTPHGLKNHNNLHHNNNNNNNSQQQTTQQTQTTATVMVKTATTAGNPLPAISKESILATFVRMKSIPCNTTASSAATAVSLNRNGIEGLPLMLTLQTNDNNSNNESKHDSQSVSDDKVAVNDNNGDRNTCPIITAPTLQQHLLSPLIGKSSNITVTKVL